MKTRLYKTTIFMLTMSVMMSASIAKAQYSNASLDVPWIVSIEDPNDTTHLYITFNGSGSIDQLGVYGMTPGPVGTYSVNASGSFNGAIAGMFDFYGQLNSTTEAFLYAVMGPDTVGPLPMSKVESPNALLGNWSGSMIQDVSLTTTNLSFNIDAEGKIMAAFGVIGPTFGTFCTEDGFFVAHVATGETNEYAEIHFTGDYLGDTIIGRFGLDCNQCEGGTFMFTRVSNGVKESSKILTNQNAYPSPFQDHLTIDYNLEKGADVKISIFSIEGREIEVLFNSKQNSGKHALNWGTNTIASGQYILVYNIDGQQTTKRIIKQ